MLGWHEKQFALQNVGSRLCTTETELEKRASPKSAQLSWRIFHAA